MMTPRGVFLWDDDSSGDRVRLVLDTQDAVLKQSSHTRKQASALFLSPEQGGRLYQD